MGLRDVIEDLLLKAVDENLDADKLRKLLHDLVDKLVDENADELIHKLKADLIDLVDGKDEIK